MDRSRGGYTSPRRHSRIEHEGVAKATELVSASPSIHLPLFVYRRLQFGQQCLCLHQIRGHKALGEPAVDSGQ